MCGITDLLDLCHVVRSKQPIYTKSIIGSDAILFVYVKNYCHWSKKACHTLLKCREAKILDLINREFVSYDKASDTFVQQCTHVPKCLFKAFVEGDTVPQIFIYEKDGWKYIGGCDTLMALDIAEPTTPLLLTDGYSSGCRLCTHTSLGALKM